MKIFVAGAAGVVGRQLLPRLASAGHQVVGMTHSSTKTELIRAMGADPMVGDALDREAVIRAVTEAQPEVIVHELTALSGAFDMRRPDQTFALTNRLRTEATDHLLSAGRAVGVRRFVAQSFAGWPYARSGGPVKREDDPLDPRPVRTMESTLAAIQYLEKAVTDAEWTDGIVLRYGGLYGPGTSLSPEGEYAQLIRRRRFPVVGSGAGVWSFVHVEDAAEATAIAVERGRPGIYNIVDDEPAAVSDWLPALAEALKARPPLHVPRLVGRLLAGEAAVVMMTETRGASNEKARRELGWRPGHSSWREGFASAVA